MERPDIATYPPDVLLVFIGYSKDAEAEAFAIRDLQREMQRELEHLQSVQKSRLRFTQMRCWEWDSDAALEDRRDFPGHGSGKRGRSGRR